MNPTNDDCVWIRKTVYGIIWSDCAIMSAQYIIERVADGHWVIIMVWLTCLPGSGRVCTLWVVTMVIQTRYLHHGIYHWACHCCHGMGMLSAILDLCVGNPSISGGFPHKGPLMGSFDSLLLTRISCWTSCRVAVGLRRRGALMSSTGQDLPRVMNLCPLWVMNDVSNRLLQKYQHVSVWQHLLTPWTRTCRQFNMVVADILSQGWKFPVSKRNSVIETWVWFSLTFLL